MIERVSKSGVVFFRSTLIESPHGFSTRLGGVSSEIHTESMNLAFGRGDSRETVMENLRIFGNVVGFDPESTVSLGQIHSADVLYVDGEMRGHGYLIDSEMKCDGYVTDKKGIAVGIKTADCVPILFEGKDGSGNVVAVGAAHAGWRGTLGGIAVKCLLRLKELGVRAENVRAAIGPAICFDCFSVKEDLLEAFTRELGRECAERYVIKNKSLCGSYNIDLKQFNKDRLLEAGMRPENIDLAEECTKCLPSLFYSHRATGDARGAMLSVISM